MKNYLSVLLLIATTSLPALIAGGSAKPGSKPLLLDPVYTLPRVSWWHSWACRSRNQELEQLCQPLTIRQQALMMVHCAHAGALNLGQICDIYDYLRSNWVHIPDPYRAEYFANAAESLTTFRGDCDDLAIALATCIRAVGGLTRVVGAYHVDGGHAYAQVCLGQTGLLRVDQYLQQRYGEPRERQLDFHTEIDDWGNIWLNLDTRAGYPGAPLFVDQSRFVFILGHPEYCIR